METFKKITTAYFAKLRQVSTEFYNIVSGMDVEPSRVFIFDPRRRDKSRPNNSGKGQELFFVCCLILSTDCEESCGG